MTGAKRRDHSLDALRTVAILLMMASHTTRLIEKDARRWWSDLAMLIEPLTASLFLLLVGAALARSWMAHGSAGRGDWLKRTMRRAAGLFALSSLFFALEHGFYLPDALLSSGILVTIAFALILISLPVSSNHPQISLWITAMSGTALYLYLDVTRREIFMLTSGNSPWLPLLIFTVLGALGVLHSRKNPDKAARVILIAGFFLVAGSLWMHSFEALFSKPLGRYGYVREMPAGFWGPAKNVAYYNLRPALMPMIIGLCCLLYAGLHALRRFHSRIAGQAFAMGRKSLQVYVLHLLILALWVVSLGVRPFDSSWQGDVVLIGLVVLCQGWAIFRESRSRRIIKSEF